MVNGRATILVGGGLSVAGVRRPIVTSARAIAGGGLAAATQRTRVSAARAQAPARAGAVSAQAVTAKTAQLLVYDPASPVIGAGGFAQTPEIDPVSEITHQIAAGRAFAFSLEALKAAVEEQKQLLDLTT